MINKTLKGFILKGPNTQMDREELKAIIKSTGEITFSKHAKEVIDTKERPINEDMIHQFIKNYPEKLTGFVDQGEESLGHKFKLTFYKSNVYDAVIVISLHPNNSNLNIVTVYIQNRAKKRKLNIWQKGRT